MGARPAAHHGHRDAPAAMEWPEALGSTVVRRSGSCAPSEET